MECLLCTKIFNTVVQHPVALVNDLIFRGQRGTPTAHEHEKMLNLQDYLCKLNSALI
jgi:hypothetical protein